MQNLAKKVQEVIAKEKKKENTIENNLREIMNIPA